jgi:hypothetical protein
MAGLNTKVEASGVYDVKGEARAYGLDESLRKDK